MSISPISNTFNTNQMNSQSFQLQNSQFRQLGQDLTSGNLSAAQSDYAILQQALGQVPSVSSTSSSNPIAQAFQQLSTDLKSGNLSAAKQDYSTIQQDVQRHTSGFPPRSHHIASSGDQNTLLQELNQLGQDFSAASLSSGNTNAAQQAYADLLPTFGGGAGTSTLAATASTAAPDSNMSVSLIA